MRAWLFGIARHVLADSLDRGRVQASARARLGMAALSVDERLIASVEETAGSSDDALVEDWLSRLPEGQHVAVRSRVLEERSYRDIAASFRETLYSAQHRKAGQRGRDAPGRQDEW